LREKVLGGFAPEEVYKTAQNPNKSGTKKRHNLDDPLDCATFYEDRQRPSFCHNALNFRFIQPNFSKNPKIPGKNRKFGSKKAKNTPTYACLTNQFFVPKTAQSRGSFILCHKI
jgi:hypothetical protein